ncbi:alpha/beta hydrolase [Paenibacillus fonticola]|uniref:alpha/beta hydrolase n=1 Tax=Paenibacillus fonticola TaxID=379896 RepID=UPI00036FDC64|nr:alpha/beta hydrolase [Paenibacillus fonticola]
MIHEKLKLFEHSQATLTTYVLEDGEYDRKNLIRPAVVVCPGGGYTVISQNEGEPVALAYARAGYQAFVLNYSVKIDNPFPTALRELAKAMSIIRENAQKWLIDPNDISVVGFSAGGNLALSLGVNFQKSVVTSEIGLTSDQIKPNRLILGYPAVTLQARSTETPAFIIEMMEKGLMPDMRGPSIQEILIGKENLTDEEIESLNLLQYLHNEMPQTFIWGTYEDTVIPPTDLLGLAEQLYKCKVPCELHLYEKGPHGMSLGDETVKDADQIDQLSIGTWFDLSLKWLKQTRK